MSLPTFYHDASLIKGEVIVLSPGESRHARSARRLNPGARVRIINGRGGFAEGEIQAIPMRGGVEVLPESAGMETEPAFRLEIASALPKGDRVKVMLDMLTQLGVFAFIPLDCERSENRYRSVMAEKWRKVIIESCKQCNRARVMDIQPETRAPVDLVLHRLAAGVPVLVCDPNGDPPGVCRDVVRTEGGAAIMIGPEGGFTRTELRLMEDAGCRLFRLPGHIMRTETASIAAAVHLCKTGS
jgi:16S rRNA (uracil1498-N3)-methyltransferase